MYTYKEMREALDERIPEILNMPYHLDTVGFWRNEEIPTYCYYETLEHLFIDLITGTIKDDGLLERVLDFMEDMANSEDWDVRNLVQIQILDGLFGLERDEFLKMERMLCPETSKLLEESKHRFYEPNGYAPKKVDSPNARKKKKKNRK